MISTTMKRSVLAGLRVGDGTTAVSAVAELRPTEERELIRWLDESGLTLYLADRNKTEDLVGSIPELLKAELMGRVEQNEVRTKRLLEDFERVNERLATIDISYAVLKGFSLAPDFCARPSSRHQTDIDILIHREHVERAIEALRPLGYATVSREGCGEVKLSTPSNHIPRRTDDLYAIPRHSCVEFHVDIFEPANEVALPLLEDWEDAREQRMVEGIEFPSLDRPHRMLVQLLHAFRHVLHGWLRLGWLYEINYAIERYRDDVELWSILQRLLSADVKARRGCGLVLELTRTLFGTELPTAAEAWVAELSPAMRLWVSEYGSEWALADFPGSRLSLLVHREFVDDRNDWQKFRSERLALALRAITPRKLLNLPFVYEEFRERVQYVCSFMRWRRLRAEAKTGERLQRLM